jgi:hypothetical protein
MSAQAGIQGDRALAWSYISWIPDLAVLFVFNCSGLPERSGRVMKNLFGLLITLVFFQLVSVWLLLPSPRSFETDLSLARVQTSVVTVAEVSAQESMPGSPDVAPRRFANPFAYCAAVGTIDAPDDRYTGPPMPQAIARGLKRAFGAPESAPLTPFLENSFWRCMGGKVYACNVGANLPCQGKADISRTPNAGMLDFCKENPDTDFIPAVATGRETVYAWQCTNGAPTITREVVQPDARGFLKNIWYEIPPP